MGNFTTVQPENPPKDFNDWIQHLQNAIFQHELEKERKFAKDKRELHLKLECELN